MPSPQVPQTQPEKGGKASQPVPQYPVKKAKDIRPKDTVVKNQRVDKVTFDSVGQVTVVYGDGTTDTFQENDGVSTLS